MIGRGGWWGRAAFGLDVERGVEEIVVAVIGDGVVDLLRMVSWMGTAWPGWKVGGYSSSISMEASVTDFLRVWRAAGLVRWGFPAMRIAFWGFEVDPEEGVELFGDEAAFEIADFGDYIGAGGEVGDVVGEGEGGGDFGGFVGVGGGAAGDAAVFMGGEGEGLGFRGGVGGCGGGRGAGGWDGGGGD